MSRRDERHEKAREAVRQLLQHVGEDPDREGLRETPRRVVRALSELTEGYAQDADKILAKDFDSEGYDAMVLVRDVPFQSLCEHHLLPFFGTATVAYIPKERVVGLSKLARLVHCFARRLQLQERLTEQVAGALRGAVSPHVGVIVKARHLCMELRGVRTPGETVTSCLLGDFREDPAVRTEFLRLADGR